MSVRAKFVCSEITRRITPIWDGGNGYAATETRTVKLQAVTGRTGENSIFGKATPHGCVEITVVDPAVAALFEPGREYYADFTPAEG